MPGGDMYEIHIAFRDWASNYDDPAFQGRNRARHESWFSEQSVPIVRLDGSHEVHNLVLEVVVALKENHV